MKTHTRTIRNAAEAQNFIRYLGNAAQFPFTVTVTPGAEKRSNAQNRLQHAWFKDAEQQGDNTAEEYRAYCKLHFGCRVLYHEDEEFRDAYDRVLRGLTYEQKLAAMVVPLDLPVTSRMSVKQKTKYLDMMWQHFSGMGYQLTDPSMLGLDGWNEFK